MTLRDRYLYALANKCKDCGGVEGVRCEYVSEESGYDVPCYRRTLRVERRRKVRAFWAVTLAALLVVLALARPVISWTMSPPAPDVPLEVRCMSAASNADRAACMMQG